MSLHLIQGFGCLELAGHQWWCCVGRRLRLERYQFDPSRAGLRLDIFGSLVLDAAKLYEGSWSGKIVC